MFVVRVGMTSEELSLFNAASDALAEMASTIIGHPCQIVVLDMDPPSLTPAQAAAAASVIQEPGFSFHRDGLLSIWTSVKRAREVG